MPSTRPVTYCVRAFSAKPANACPVKSQGSDPPLRFPNSTARKTSGSSCVRIGCQTGFSNPSTISSTTAATLGTHSSTNPGRSCPLRDATGQQSVTQSEDWYDSSAAPSTLKHGAYIPLDHRTFLQ